MLNLYSVENIGIDDVINQEFDLGIFASGFEERSSFLARIINFNNIKKAVVFGFTENSGKGSRSINDDFYRSKNIDPILVSASDEKIIYSTLIEILTKYEVKNSLRVLIDYTSMSRLWYSGVLHYFRLLDVKVEVYLNYSLGIYEKKTRDTSYISINSLPSHEGSLSTNSKTLLVVSIGFSPYMIKSVIEEIEPNEIIGIVPISEDYKDMSNNIMDKLSDIEDWILCPIDNLEKIFREYTEIAKKNFELRDIIFLSVGPKIFTLASLLVSQRFEHVTCLYLKYANYRCDDIKASGKNICNKIIYDFNVD